MLVYFHYIFAIAMGIKKNRFPEICNDRNMCVKIKRNYMCKKIADQFVIESPFVKLQENFHNVIAAFNIFSCIFHSLFFVSITIVTGPSLSSSTFMSAPKMPI